ncbi:MAG: DNA polymerase I, partial [Cyclobacteriaceae bacterium]|nr:DNA polymerase I [Cyclobacteriaceae bacterium]
MPEQPTLFLLDALALIYRAHFAMSKNPRITSQGINTGAVLGFTNTLLEIIQKEKPSHIAVVFDTPAPTFRHIAYPDYKATRQSQPEEIGVAIPLCKHVIEGFNIPILELDGFEADDIIGTLAKKASENEFKVFMMTPDKDYAQLVSENIFLYKPAFMGNSVEILGIPEVLAKFDIQHVSQVCDVLGLKGDSVDNIPGVPGIGDKTASKLLKEYGTVENIVENTAALKGSIKTKFEEFGQQGIFSKELATINTQVPITFDEDSLKYTGPVESKLRPLFDELEFRTLAKRVFAEPVSKMPSSKNTSQLDLFGAPEATDIAPSQPEKNDISTVKHHYQLADTPEKRAKLISILATQKEFCFDTETTSLETVEAELVGLAICYEAGTAYYIPFPEDRKETTSIIREFEGVLSNPAIRKIGQNLKYDIQILRNYHVKVLGPLFDTMLAHYLIDP